MNEREHRPQNSRRANEKGSINRHQPDRYGNRNNSTPYYSNDNSNLSMEELDEDDEKMFNLAGVSQYSDTYTISQSQQNQIASIPNAGWSELGNKDNYNGIDTSNWKTPDGRDLPLEEKQQIASVYQGSTIPGFVIASYGALGSRALWKAFGQIVARRFGERAAFAATINAGDPISPVAELLTLGLAALTIYQIYRAWDDIWGEVEQELGNPNSEIVVTQEPENQVYTTPNGEQQTVEHTGSVPPQVETGTPPFDTETGREIEQQQHTGNTTQQEVDWDNYIFESRRRNLQGHDDEGGHTDDRHIGKSERWLRKRINRENLDEASSFYDYPAANLTQARFIKKYKKEIDAWVKSDKTENFVEDIEMNRNIGIHVPKNGKVNDTNSARVVLKKDSSELGYHIRTSYPVP